MIKCLRKVYLEIPFYMPANLKSGFESTIERKVQVHDTC